MRWFKKKSDPWYLVITFIEGDTIRSIDHIGPFCSADDALDAAVDIYGMGEDRHSNAYEAFEIVGPDTCRPISDDDREWAEEMTKLARVGTGHTTS